jgi:hypothetical protein
MSENDENIENKTVVSEDLKNKDNFENNSKVELQLGDIIKIVNPRNERLNNQEFFIQYIDLQKMLLLNPETGEIIKQKISPEGIIGDGTIQELIILSRSDSAGYAIQNGLTANKWINIHFGGEFPLIITGEITNLENDMIEIRTIDNDTLYINFDYKGIPEDLPIEFIEIREKPQESLKKMEEEPEEHLQLPVETKFLEPGEIIDLEELEREKVVIPAERIQIGVPTKNIKNQLREFIIQADQIQFGREELGMITQFVDVAKEKQRYSIDEQVADLLDDLLSTVPNAQRTQKVLNNIHTIIERFKQLREHFSAKDEYGNIDGVLVLTADFKPLINYFHKFKQNLYWILPVVENVKKIYNANTEDIEENLDVKYLDIDEDIVNMDNFIERYKSNSEQNKYSQLYNNLNPFFTPFLTVDEEKKHNFLTEKEPECNIHVIVDNIENDQMENMFSYVFAKNKIYTKKFVMEKYTTGLTKLSTVETEGMKPTSIVVNMTDPDLMSIKSFVTLPEPVVRFSKINLPNTNLLDKANLNLAFFNYWKFLNNDTRVNQVYIEDLNQDLQFTEDNFVNNVKNFILQLSENDKKTMSQKQIYKEFIQKIVPKIRVLFNLMKKYIKGKLSIVDVVEYLEPFLIYTDDLTYMQYKDIIQFISEKISEYNNNIRDRSRIMAILNKFKSKPTLTAKAFSILFMLEQKDNIKEEVLSAYDIVNDYEIEFTNSEILKKNVQKDYNKLYTTALSLQSAPLMFPSEFAVLFETEQEKINKKIGLEEDKGTCKPKIVAKQYTSVEQLEEDNNKTIYFDKKFDKTNYGLLDEYEKDMMRMTPEDFIAHLIKEIKKKQQLNDEDAEYLAETLIDGHKKVINGQYAILYYGNHASNQNNREDIDYFIRTNNVWTKDNSIEKGTNTTDPDLLCNLQNRCISVPSSKVDDKCEGIDVDILSLQNKMLKDVVNEFDEKYRISKEEFEKNIREKFDYYLNIMPMISKIETSAMLKYSNQKYNLGVHSEDDNNNPSIVSPYSKLLNMILSQKDFVKKQYDIIRFTNTYTRPPITDGFGPLNKKESEYWLYCIKTNVELLPIFRFDMAMAFTTNPSGYNDFIDQLISKIGKESDDGDSWTAVGSGWTIRKADFDIEEGYEDGFKIVTRGTLEEDAGNKIVSSSGVTKTIKYDSPETRMISNIVNALSVAMGINIETQKEFIMNCVQVSLNTKLKQEQEYKLAVKQMADKGKKIMSYKDYYHTALMYYTLGMFLIAIQTSIPSIKTRKTHPGCIRSFNGYPFEGTGDFSSVTYLSCVAYDIRESTEPWNTIKKRETVEQKIKDAINDLVGIPDVKQKFDEKTDYLLLSPAEQIPEEHDITNWINFLPPLIPFKIKRLTNVSDEFKQELMRNLRNGSPKQRENLLVIDSKIIQFSLAIQERIQHVVTNKEAILTANNQPYLENACCQTNNGETTIGYFMNNDNSIDEYNKIVRKLTNLLMDITSYTKSGMFCSEVNTKNKYPSINQQFDEKTIYLAFIDFCKFKTLIPVPENLRSVCLEKPDYNFLTKNDSIDEMIHKLKDNGRNYKYEDFLRLMQLIGRNNIINVDLDEPVISSVASLNNLLESIDSENDDVVEAALRQKLINALNTFDIATPEITPDVRELNNYLSKQINIMKDEIVDFINENKTDIARRDFNSATSAIQNLFIWTTEKGDKNPGETSISSDSIYNIVQFYKTFISYFVTVFPNIILNEVDYSNTIIPKYMNLSSSHMGKISGYIREYYKDLKSFYGNVRLKAILNTIQKSAKNIERLSKQTPCFTSIKYGDNVLKPVFDERTSKMLYEYYLLRVLINYIDLTDEDDMIVTTFEKPMDVQDVFSVDYLEERETRANFSETVQIERSGIVRGNKKELKQIITKLFVAFFNIMDNQKQEVDISYDKIRDFIFQLKEKEKNRITDRLKALTDEDRELDTILKINKLGVWSKGLQKGLTTYDKEMYEEEANFRDEMEKAERNIRKQNHNITDENMDQYLDDYLEEQSRGEDIEREAYDMGYLNEDYYDGNYDGVEAPEDEEDDYRDYD